MAQNWQQQNYGSAGGMPPPYPGAGYPGQGGGFPNQQFGGYPGQQQQFGGGPGAMPPTMGFHMPVDPEMGNTGGPKEGSGGQHYDGMEFNDKTIRRGFIRKVYSILMIQLLVTVGLIALFIYHEGIKLWTRQNPGFVIGVMIGSIVMVIALACCESVRRKSPTNIICLGIFTILEGIVLGAISSTYKADAVILAAGITCVICLSLTLFSFQTKWDFTAIGGILFVCVIILLLFGILSMFFPVLRVAYACAGALLFSVYLVYDTQMMMGGNKKYSISPEEYIFAALNLYLDMVNIFIYILAIVGRSD